MKGVRAAVRYAKALLQLAQEKNLVETVIADVKLIHNTIEENRELGLMLKSPLIRGEKKGSILASIFGSKINQLTLKFVQLVVDHKRENSLLAICDMFINKYNELKNIAIVSITTTQTLTEELKAEVVTKIKSEYKFSEVELIENIDESLIGGMILRIGDKQLDASIRRKLTNIKQELIQA